MNPHERVTPRKSCALAPCCAPFRRFLIAPTKLEAQISWCLLDQYCSDPAASHPSRSSIDTSSRQSCELAATLISADLFHCQSNSQTKKGKGDTKYVSPSKCSWNASPSNRQSCIACPWHIKLFARRYTLTALYPLNRHWCILSDESFI